MKPLLHIYGASGSGTSTLGRYLAEQFQYAFLDSDDYFWLPTDPKFTTKRPIEQRIPLIRQDIAAAENGAVLSGSLVGWGDALIPDFTLAELLANFGGFAVYVLLFSRLSRFLILLVVLTATADFFVSHYISEWEYRHRDERE